MLSHLEAAFASFLPRSKAMEDRSARPYHRWTLPFGLAAT
jgi:hypothetical protein